MNKYQYLEEYHGITQTLIGFMRLYSSPEQREKVKVWDEKLQDLELRFMLQKPVDLDKLPLLIEIMGWDMDKAMKIYKEIHDD